jgi:hypothetical protein
MTQNQAEGIRHLNTSMNELLFHIDFADTGFHVVRDSDIGGITSEGYERSFQVELDNSSTRLGVTGLVSKQQSQYVATIHFNDEGLFTNPSTELRKAVSDDLLEELSGLIHRKLEAKQLRQSTKPQQG